MFPFDLAAAVSYGRVREELARSGKMIGANDMLIAAVAISIEATLVTNNVRDFANISGLQLENWA
jgi:tRNA(fMet)-specific endonuclease VapC